MAFFFTSACLLCLNDIPFIISQGIAIFYEFMQILKFVEAQTKKMSHRQRMYVFTFFVCGRPLISVFCQPSLKHAHPSAVLAVLTTL